MDDELRAALIAEATYGPAEADVLPCVVATVQRRLRRQRVFAIVGIAALTVTIIVATLMVSNLRKTPEVADPPVQSVPAAVSTPTTTSAFVNVQWVLTGLAFNGSPVELASDLTLTWALRSDGAAKIFVSASCGGKIGRWKATPSGVDLLNLQPPMGLDCIQPTVSAAVGAQALLQAYHSLSGPVKTELTGSVLTVQSSAGYTVTFRDDGPIIDLYWSGLVPSSAPSGALIPTR